MDQVTKCKLLRLSTALIGDLGKHPSRSSHTHTHTVTPRFAIFIMKLVGYDALFTLPPPPSSKPVHDSFCIKFKRIKKLVHMYDCVEFQ